jgi:hypothetical protein
MATTILGRRSGAGWVISTDGHIYHRCGERAVSPPLAQSCERCRAAVPAVVRLTSAIWNGWRGMTAVA